MSPLPLFRTDAKVRVPIGISNIVLINVTPSAVSDRHKSRVPIGISNFGGCGLPVGTTGGCSMGCRSVCPRPAILREGDPVGRPYVRGQGYRKWVSPGCSCGFRLRELCGRVFPWGFFECRLGGGVPSRILVGSLGCRVCPRWAILSEGDPVGRPYVRGQGYRKWVSPGYSG